MKLHKDVIEELTVRPGEPARLSTRSTHAMRTPWRDHSGKSSLQHVTDSELESFKEELASAQELLYASDTYSLLVVLQALDAAGKDGTIKHVMSGVNPQGCDVVGFKAPTAEELNHDFLWRCAKALPPRGGIGIFNRSYYEEVLITRVHPEVLAHQRLPAATAHGDELWTQRYEDINNFERHLQRNGTAIVKIYLHLSKDEQQRRFLDRLDDPAKHWKFSPADMAERAYFDDYQRAYETAITSTSTAWAPWYVVPADHKHAARALAGGVLAHTIDQLDLHVPTLSPAEEGVLNDARRTLHAD